MLLGSLILLFNNYVQCSRIAFCYYKFRCRSQVGGYRPITPYIHFNPFFITTTFTQRCCDRKMCLFTQHPHITKTCGLPLNLKEEKLLGKIIEERIFVFIINNIIFM